MALLKIARMGHPILTQTALPIDDPASERVRRRRRSTSRCG
jgi:hypothetical protein